MSNSNLPNTSLNGGTNASLKNLFLAEGEMLVKIIYFYKIQLNSTKKCEQLWEEMRKADFRKENILNEKNIQLVYEKKKNMINELLRITSAEEFLLVFDDDQVIFLLF